MIGREEKPTAIGRQETKLGKIKKAEFGFGGYQEAMLGIHFDLGGEGWGVGDFWGQWADHTEHCKWTIEDQKLFYWQTMNKIRDLLRDAKVEKVSQLIGKPIEMITVDRTLKSWRILTEVL